MNVATFVRYTEDNFTDWSEKVGAKIDTWIAVDPQENKLLKTWDQEPTLEEVESALNKINYTIGL